MKNKAQATVEVLILMSAFILMLTIFLLVVNDQIQQNLQDQEKGQTSLMLNSLKNEIQNVYFLGPGNVRIFEFDFSPNIDFEKSLIEDTYLLLNMFDSDLIVNTKINLIGNWPTNHGRHQLSIIAFPDYVGINAIYLDVFPRSINQTINQGFFRDVNLSVTNYSSENKTYSIISSFENGFADVELLEVVEEINLSSEETKNIPLRLSCSNDASGNYFGQIIFSSDYNSIVPIVISCVSSQKKLVIFPYNILLESDGSEFFEYLLVCNNSTIDLTVINSEITGSLREIVLFSFSGEIKSNECRVIRLQILDHSLGDYSGQLRVNASGLIATSNILLTNN